MTLMAVLAVPAMAWAAEAGAAAGDFPKAFAFLAAGLGFGLAAGLCGLGQGRAAGSAVDAMARQPGAIARIQTAMLSAWPSSSRSFSSSSSSRSSSFS
jgi:F-type H+-transporting ATPase subunit c